MVLNNRIYSVLVSHMTTMQSMSLSVSDSTLYYSALDSSRIRIDDDDKDWIFVSENCPESPQQSPSQSSRLQMATHWAWGILSAPFQFTSPDETLDSSYIMRPSVEKEERIEPEEEPIPVEDLTSGRIFYSSRSEKDFSLDSSSILGYSKRMQ